MKHAHAVLLLLALGLMAGCAQAPVATPTLIPTDQPLTANAQAFFEAAFALGTEPNFQPCAESSPASISVPVSENGETCITGFSDREWKAPADVTEGEIFLFLMASASENGLSPWEGKLFHIVDVPTLFLGLGPICLENNLVCAGFPISAEEATLLIRSSHVMPLGQ